MFGNSFYTDIGLQRTPVGHNDENWLDERLHNRSSRIVPVWRGHNLILGQETPQAIALTGNHARGLLQICGEKAFLGMDGDTAYFAIDLSEHELPVLSPALGQAKFVDLRRVVMMLEPHEAALLAYAKGAMYWHFNNHYCAACGSLADAKLGGRMRQCTNPDCAREHYPRSNPAVIMLVTRPGPDGGACLLGRHGGLPDGMYSTLAGFVEQGESLEQTVAREVMEESGITVTDITYRGSQPWPFPDSLMVGFRARASTVEIDLSNDELEDARWFTRAQIASFSEHGRRLPRADSIGFQLVDEWLKEG
ncbi:MAG: NAD(+) diphosphatase [Rhodospirillaceae bacterium]|nr:NAD(+) diphosphatase [Rhodospirillaceae bacterium]MBT4464371.1 NAD(+) diphosphatase [Rhodospirillaceae bacterium]MBT5013178.1 NAD(+) diphosphatase [Rhodospirillaceae bacterium]MBT5307762.1 NAD(+) diphosphatase [Rhodospirillaceae bacterium]MBT6407098.1 NAD(+) diphosphatase [Rhodospirillaceae bacterium]